MMKQYMKNKSLFLQKEELLSRIAELFSKKILRPSGSAGIPSYNVPGFILM